MVLEHRKQNWTLTHGLINAPPWSVIIYCRHKCYGGKLVLKLLFQIKYEANIIKSNTLKAFMQFPACLISKLLEYFLDVLILFFQKVLFSFVAFLTPSLFPPAWISVNVIKSVHFISFFCFLFSNCWYQNQLHNKQIEKGTWEIWFLILFGEEFIYTFIVSYKNNQFSAKTQLL